MTKKKLRLKTRRECLKSDLTVTFGLKPEKVGYDVSGLWVGKKLSKLNQKKYGVDSYWIWKTLTDWFMIRKPRLDKAVKCHNTKDGKVKP